MTTNVANDISDATVGFGHVFSNDLDAAKDCFAGADSSFHLMGEGCVAFLQAALGMETNLMSEASRLLGLAEAKAKKEAKATKANPQLQAVALAYEILHADATLLVGLTQALSESYAGYLQCMYSLNSAHSNFTRLYNTAFPDGIDKLATPSSTPMGSRSPSSPELPTLGNVSTRGATSLAVPATPKSNKGFFSRWTSAEPTLSPSEALATAERPVQELIIAGAAFGYGLFNLVLSLLPKKIQGVVGFFGFKSDRRLALQALAVAATRDDVHGVFAGLTLMTYYGAVLLLSGYQADEAHILRQYRAIVEKLAERYPEGSLWILNNAKIHRMAYDPDKAIEILERGLAPERPHTFRQADALLLFELAWTLFAQRKYKDAADMFIKMTQMNSWSPATYYFIAAGCYISLGDITEAKRLFDAIPDLLDKRRLGGRELPTEQFIRKKIAFYKQKHTRRTGSEDNFVESIRISPGEEIGLWWNVHSRITVSSAEAHIREWLALSPPIDIKTPYATQPPQGEGQNSNLRDIDTPDELALRSLLLGVVHRSISHFAESRSFLLDVAKHPVEGKWTKALALFELVVLKLKEAEASDKESPLSTETPTTADSDKSGWTAVLDEANNILDQASEAAVGTDLASRLDSRINMLRDEIALKRKMVLGQ